MTPLIVFEKPREVVHTPMIDNIHRLEQAMIDSGKELLGEGDITHFFTPGMYVREIHMPKDTLWTTKVHKTEHVFIISKGKVAVTTEDGQIILEAPHTGITKPGTKRALYILEDTVWTTMHVTEQTDVKLIEQDIIAQTYDEYLLYHEEQKLLENK